MIALWQARQTEIFGNNPLTVLNGSHFRIGGKSSRPRDGSRQTSDDAARVIQSENESLVVPPFLFLPAFDRLGGGTELEDFLT